ncbi:MAG TPA: radical SAM family heme chaperone HemW [Terriglobales bacterium]|nr:radical SAM family heme chaperone HemW [Terriglobales bacterium]
MPTGLYISVPFCRSKCSYCNFASGVFSAGLMTRYVERVCDDMRSARQTAARVGAEFDLRVDSIYVGGGTPTALAPEDLQVMLDCPREVFEVAPGAEITVECAPGTLTPEMLQTLVGFGVNRVSLGVQSFVDREAAAVGRLHNRAVVLDDIARLRALGVGNINLDLIAGLPHQTAESWKYSLDEALAVVPPHISVYMLEVDEDSRLGREVIAGGTRYHAHDVPSEDLVAELYEIACQKLGRGGYEHYEISNFCWKGAESRHNLKYWTRQPYLGFGVDAHSMLPASGGDVEAVRFATTDDLDAYLAGEVPASSFISRQAALEETLFLGLRLNRGVDLQRVALSFGESAIRELIPIMRELERDRLAELAGRVLRLTDRGRLLSNEVFQRFLAPQLHA